MTFGGDLVRDLGGEKAIMEEGRGFGLLHGACSVDLPRGVADTDPLYSERLGVDVRGPFSRGMSNDILPSVLLLSSGIRRRSVALGVGCLGGAAAGALFELSMFSKWLRREETGFC